MKRINHKRYSGGSYHWCPNGCGKSVQHTSWNTIKSKWIKRCFYCLRCGKKFKKEELKE